jgi:hypothetical protein
MNGWGTWNANWIWSLALIAITITIHAVGVVFIATILQRLTNKELNGKRSFLETGLGAVVLIVGVALLLMVFHGIECLVWAIVYVHLGALPSPASAVLYSVDSMTTRGSSDDLNLDNKWRVMGATEAADGMLLFGVSTAFLFYVMVRVWKNEFPR